MALCGKSSRIPLPKRWPQHVKAAILHVMSLAQYAAAYTPRASQSDARLTLAQPVRAGIVAVVKAASRAMEKGT